AHLAAACALSDGGCPCKTGWAAGVRVGTWCREQRPVPVGKVEALLEGSRLPSRSLGGRAPRAPLRRYPTPSCAACPAPAKGALHRAPPGTPCPRQGRGYAWRSPSMMRGHDRASPPRYAPAFHREPGAMSNDTTALVSSQRQPQLDEHYCSSDKPVNGNFRVVAGVRAPQRPTGYKKNNTRARVGAALDRMTLNIM